MVGCDRAVPRPLPRSMTSCSARSRSRRRAIIVSGRAEQHCNGQAPSGTAISQRVGRPATRNGRRHRCGCGRCRPPDAELGARVRARIRSPGRSSYAMRAHEEIAAGVHVGCARRQAPRPLFPDDRRTRSSAARSAPTTRSSRSSRRPPRRTPSSAAHHSQSSPGSDRRTIRSRHHERLARMADGDESQPTGRRSCTCASGPTSLRCADSPRSRPRTD